MNDSEGIINRSLTANKPVAKLLILFFLAVAVMWSTAIFVQEEYGVEWFPALNATGSVALTAILATLYFRQSKVLESQQELLSAELNRGVREGHTEILRERVQEWHGNIDVDFTEVDPWNAPSDNLPSVGKASFQSAGTGGYYTGSDDDFTAIPYQLEDDRYFRDLLENHATDLRTKAQRIEILQSEFEKTKSEFDEKFDYAKTVQHDQYTLQPKEFITEWVFEQLVRIERESLEFEEVRSRMLAQIDGSRKPRNKSIVRVERSVADINKGVYVADFGNDQSVPPREDWDKIENEVKELFDLMLDELASDAPLDEIQLAAELLDDGAKATKDLRHTLVEYNGRLVYPGDCKYLQEAEIRPSERN